jgi:hypothetical protein
MWDTIMIITIIVLLIGGPFSFLHSKEAGCTTMAIWAYSC